MRGLLALVLLVGSIATGLADELITPERRAVAFLSVEVPKWARENKCFSCHNNGDALHGLLTAAKAGELADRKPLADTLAFLASPERWDANGPDGPFKDTKLRGFNLPPRWPPPSTPACRSSAGTGESRRIGGAAAIARRQLADRRARQHRLARHLRPALATATSIRTLSAADRRRTPCRWPRLAAGSKRPSPKTCSMPRPRCWRWLRRPVTRCRQCASAAPCCCAKVNRRTAAGARSSIRRLKCSTRPWSCWPWPAQQPTSELSAFIARGRKYLLAEQSPDGSWPATTRPAGADSYAQQLSTTGWALQVAHASRERAGK